ncbi:helix-turn-helix domain-containing protein [Actinoallomurus sp. CA-150999]|uniref:helix-turn-helix domain-containing protein n=1 Tax=Actinoallomurus sp. CA-150999 TaxID=3239887 RepID=UPI003D9282ED
MDKRYGPVELPARSWHQGEVHSALRARDIPALLRLVQRYTGASQARLATAFAMGQGRVNEIINGRRQVTRLDVFERIADGLAMPDEARVLFGLAPAHAAVRGVLTGHAEIARVFTDQAEAYQELRDLAATATEISILAVRTLGLISLNDSLLRGPLTQRATPVSVRMLLLDPDAPTVATRSSEIGESPESFATGIRLAIARLAEFDGHPYVTLRTALYNQLPTWRMLGFDGTLYVSAFGTSREGHRSGMYKLTAASGGVLHAGFRRQFDEMWRQARHLGMEGRSVDRGRTEGTRP